MKFERYAIRGRSGQYLNESNGRLLLTAYKYEAEGIARERHAISVVTISRNADGVLYAADEKRLPRRRKPLAFNRFNRV